MDIRKIQKLIKIVENSEISELSIEDQETKISIKKTGESALPTEVTIPLSASTPSAPSLPQVVPEQKQSAEKEEEGLIPIISPMIGTFYRAPSPDAPPFIEVGDRVEKGQIVCIIEAMKLFNEIESEIYGRVVKVLVKNGEAVEYGQKLILIKPEE